MSIRKWYKGASGAIALALSAAVVLPARADDGGDADIAASKEAEQRTKADISNTEARLTQIGVKANRLKVDAAKAEAASIAAQQRLSTSIGEAMGAQDAVDSADKQVDAARRQLVLERPCPVALLEVVVLHATELLDGVVAAVVIGQHEALRGDDLARTAAVEADDGILERAAVGVVEVVLLHLKATCGEAAVLLAQLLHQPHTAVSLRT